MKVRHGFVSNSSSSSFILLLNENPNSDDLAKAMFPSDPELTQNFRGYSMGSISAAEAVDNTMSAMELFDPNEHPLSFSKYSDFNKDIFGEIAENYKRIRNEVDEARSRIEGPRDEQSKLWESTWNKENEEMEKFVIGPFLEYVKSNGYTLYVVEWSDGGGCGHYNETMENGGIYDEMIKSGRCIMINNH